MALINIVWILKKNNTHIITALLCMYLWINYVMWLKRDEINDTNILYVRYLINNCEIATRLDDHVVLRTC